MNSSKNNHSVYALAFGAHPDDVELCVSATLLKIMREGLSVAVCDLTKGEMGTRGNALTRKQEAEKATAIMGYSARITLNLGDGKFEANHANMVELVKIIRHFRPVVVFANPPEERHPDHKRAASLVTDAVFYSGLTKLKTSYKGKPQEAHRPLYLLHYIHDRYSMPSFIVDVSDTFDDSRKAILAFSSQFGLNASKEPETYISRSNFLVSIEARAKVLGEAIGCKYGEGFILKKTLGIRHFTSMFEARDIIT